MASQAYDIIVFADWRRPFEPAWYLSNLLQAQIAAGYRTAVIQVDGPAGDPLHGFSAPVRRLIDGGRIDWLDPDRPVEATLAVAVDPLTFARPADRRPRISCERSILVCDRQILDESEQPRFDLEQIRDNVDELFDRRSLWVAGTSLIRAELAAFTDLVPLDEDDWTPVLKAEEMRVDRLGLRAARPVLGVLATGPDSALSKTDLRQLLPDDPSSRCGSLAGRPACEQRFARGPRPGAFTTALRQRPASFSPSSTSISSAIWPAGRKPWLWVRCSPWRRARSHSLLHACSPISDRSRFRSSLDTRDGGSRLFAMMVPRLRSNARTRRPCCKSATVGRPISSV
jgi:hypothetical protein